MAVFNPWNGFLNSIAKPAGDAIMHVVKPLAAEGIAAVKPFIGGAASAGISEVTSQAAQGGQISPDTEQALNKRAQEGLQKTLTEVTKPAKPINDILLKTAVTAEAAMSHVVTRPLSAVALLTDMNSPLYRAGEYEQGFQPMDIVRAYNRSEKVSVMEALTKSDLTVIKPLSNVVLRAGGLEPDKIDLWDDKSIKASFHDNVVGKWFTGIGDFVISNVAISGEGKIIANSAKMALKGAGLMAKEKSVAQMAMDIEDGFKAMDTAGAEGRVTNISNDMSKLANSKDLNEIISITRTYSNNELLPDVLVGVTDRAIVRDLILADKGDLTAMDRLANNGSSHLLGSAADVPAQLAGQMSIKEGVVTADEIDPLGRINKAFDDAIKANPEMAKIKEALIDLESGKARNLGTSWAPAEPVIMREQLTAARNVIQDLKTSAITRDFRNVDGFVENWIGDKGWATRMVTLGASKGAQKLAVGATSRMPTGIVRFNGIRPYDIVDELNGFFDNMKMFQDGSNVIRTGMKETMTSAEYRNNVMSSVMEAIADPAKLNTILENLDARIGHDLARTKGIYKESEITALVDQIKANTQKAYSSIIEKGYAIDERGNRILITAQTQQQLKQAYRFARWDIFEKEIIRREGEALKAGVRQNLGVASDIASSVYSDAVKIWSFDALARPSFIVKQSYMEPLISAFLAQGGKYMADLIPSATKNFLKNMNNRVMEQVARVYQGEELYAVNKAVQNVSKQLDEAIAMRDELHHEWSAMYEKKNLSPKTIEENGPYVASQLKAAEAMVDKLELEYRASVKPFGMNIPEVPSIASLERRIKFLDTQAPKDVRIKYASQVANAKAVLGKAKGEINSLMPNVAELTAKNKEIADAYENIDFIVGNLKSTLKEQAELFGRSAEYKKRYYGKGADYRMINGQWVNIESLYDENKWGQAYRDELANAQTAAATYAGELRIGTHAGLLGKRRPRGVVDITHPKYFEELAYVMNRNWRGDPLINRILAGQGEPEIIAWGRTEAGAQYLRKFDITADSDIPNYVRQKIGMVDRYLPNAEAQSRVLSGEVTSVDLQKILANDIDRMSPIHPNDFDYDGTSLWAGKKGIAGIEEAINRGISYTFQQLAKPENPLRWAYADKSFMDNVARKANFLASQGAKIDLAQLNTLRQAAAREAVQETEKVFYTVNRPLRALHAARMVTAFPSATFNAFYRYGRLAVKNPVRTAGFLHDYQGAFRSFGIDQYGNPVTDPTEAQYIIIPGTNDLGIDKGKGVRLNARSLGFLLNLPSPNPFAALPVAKIMKDYPGTETAFKTIMGPMYDIVFPYGPTVKGTPMDVAKETFLPQWLRDWQGWARSSRGKKDYLTSQQSVFDYYNTLVENKIIDKTPSYDDMMKEAASLWKRKARWEFFSPAGVPIKVDVKPMDIFDQYYGLLLQKYAQKGMSWEQQKSAAEEEFLAQVGSSFRMDRVTMKNTSSIASLPATQSAYKRISDGKNIDLIDSLYNIDPKTVGLLGLDIDSGKEGFSTAVYNYFKDPEAKLPNGKPLNNLALTPKELEVVRQNNRTWNLYIAMKDSLTKQALNTPGVHSLAGLKGGTQTLKIYANTILKDQNPTWWKDEYQMGKSTGDKSYIYSQALSQIVAAPSFMEKYGKSPLWQDVKKFMNFRDSIVNLYNSLPEGSQQKTNVKIGWDNYTTDTISQWHPQLQNIINRYFDNDTLKAVR